ncbi:MAG: type II toxin-antitoxin system ParD family antitoxin [Rickettsiales bacterium]
MTMLRKTITISDTMESWVKSQINSGLYGNDSEYFRDLIRRDQSQKLAEQRLRSLVDDSLESGISESKIPDIMRKVEDRLIKNGKL